MSILVFELAKKFSKTQIKGMELRSLSGGADIDCSAESCRVIVRNQKAGDDAPYEKLREEAARFREESGCKLHIRGMGKSLELTTAVESGGEHNAVSVMMAFLGRINFVNEEHNDFIDFYNSYIGFCTSGEKLGIAFAAEAAEQPSFIVTTAEMNEKAGKLTVRLEYPIELDEDKVYDTMMPILERYNFGLLKLGYIEQAQ